KAESKTRRAQWALSPKDVKATDCLPKTPANLQPTIRAVRDELGKVTYELFETGRPNRARCPRAFPSRPRASAGPLARVLEAAGAKWRGGEGQGGRGAMAAGRLCRATLLRLDARHFLEQIRMRLKDRFAGFDELWRRVSVPAERTPS